MLDIDQGTPPERANALWFRLLAPEQRATWQQHGFCVERRGWRRYLFIERDTTGVVLMRPWRRARFLCVTLPARWDFPRADVHVALLLFVRGAEFSLRRRANAFLLDDCYAGYVIAKWMKANRALLEKATR